MAQSLQEYSDTIASSVKTVNRYLKENGLPQPSFDIGAPSVFPGDAPQDVSDARKTLIEKARELYMLAMWPDEAASAFLQYGMAEACCLGALHDNGVLDAIPKEPGSSIKISDLTKKCGVGNKTNQITRFIDRLQLAGALKEPAPDHVAHTAMSVLYSRGEKFHSEAAWFTNIGLKSVATMNESLRALGSTGEPDRSNGAFNKAFDTPQPFLEWMTHHPAQEKQFSDIMGSFFKTPPFRIEHMATNYPWSSFGKAHVVDVGGNTGLVSLAVAKVAPELRFTVQDQEGTAKLGEETLPAEYRDRFEFQTHDFFTPNPISEPDFFMMRHILHDWPDSEGRKILRGVTEKMAPGGKTKLLIMDSIHTKTGKRYYDAVGESNLEIFMLSVFNGIERTADHWETLLKSVDQKLRIARTISPPACVASIIEVVKDA